MFRLILTGLVVVLFVAGCSLSGPTIAELEKGLQPTIGVPPADSSDQEGAETVNRIRIMSFNIHRGEGTDGKFDLDRVAEVIRTANADIVGLQEVDKNFGSRSQNLDLAVVLAEKLGMYYAYGPALKRTSFSLDFEAGYFGNAVLSRYPIVFAENVVMERQNTRENRAFLHTVVDIGGETINFVVTHLGLNDIERENHVEQILSYMRPLTGAKFLVGDWNATPDKPEVVRVTKELLDTAVAVGKESNYTYDYNSPEPGVPNVRIDFVFASGVEVKDNLVIHTDASDHWPVIAEVAIRASSEDGGDDSAQ